MPSKALTQLQPSVLMRLAALKMQADSNGQMREGREQGFT